MGISNDYDIEICLAPSGNYQKWLSIEVLKICFHENSTGLLKKEKKNSKHQKIRF